MTLRRLMKNYMTIQSSRGAGQGKDGAINRANSWLNIFENVQCNVQEKSKDTVTERFSKQTEEHKDLIYHLSSDINSLIPTEQVQLRILVNANDPTVKITDYSENNSDGIIIYDFMGHIHQVKAKGLKFYILRCKRSNRWSL